MKPDGDNWQLISTAPRDRVIELALYYVPSEEARRNGSRPMWNYGKGQWLWSGILGMVPSHWREP